MNRAHDRVLVPPPARAPLAAFALAEQPFGFTAADVAAVQAAAARSEDRQAAGALRDLGAADPAAAAAARPPQPDESSGGQSGRETRERRRIARLRS